MSKDVTRNIINNAKQKQASPVNTVQSPLPKREYQKFSKEERDAVFSPTAKWEHLDTGGNVLSTGGGVGLGVFPFIDAIVGFVLLVYCLGYAFYGAMNSSLEFDFITILTTYIMLFQIPFWLGLLMHKVFPWFGFMFVAFAFWQTGGCSLNL